MIYIRLTIRPVLVQCSQRFLICPYNHDVWPNVEFVVASHRMRLVGIGLLYRGMLFRKPGARFRGLRVAVRVRPGANHPARGLVARHVPEKFHTREV